MKTHFWTCWKDYRLERSRQEGKFGKQTWNPPPYAEFMTGVTAMGHNTWNINQSQDVALGNMFTSFCSLPGRRYPAWQWPGPGSWRGGKSPAGGARGDGGVVERGPKFCSLSLSALQSWLICSLSLFALQSSLFVFFLFRPQCLTRIRMNWKYSPK